MVAVDVGHGLGEAAGTQRAVDEACAVLLLGEAADVVGGAGDGGGDVGHAEEAQDLLDEVGLAGEVGTERGRHHRVGIDLGALVRGRARGLNLAAQAAQEAQLDVVGDVGTAHGTRALRAEGDARELGKLGDDADPAHKAEAIRRFVVATVGQECYDDALAYVDVDGIGADGCVGVMGVFAEGIAQVILDHVGAEKAGRVSRYLGRGDLELV